MQATDRLFPLLVMYSEGPDGLSQVWKDGEIQAMMARFVPVLQDACAFLERVHQVLKVLLQQLAFLASSGKSSSVSAAVGDYHDVTFMVSYWSAVRFLSN